MEEKGKRRTRVCFLVSGAGMVQWAVYVLLGKALGNTGLEYRLWILTMERLLFWFVVLPTGIAGIYGVMWNHDGGVLGKAAAWAVRMVCVFLFAVAILTGLLFLADSVSRKERKISKEVLLESYELLEGGMGGSYYQPYGIFLKKKYVYYEEPVVLAVLGERYGKSVEVGNYYEAEREDGRGYCVFELIPEGEPEMRYHVIPVPGIMPAYLDDYKEKTALERLKGYEGISGKERFQETKDEEYGVLSRLAAVCEGKTDMEDCAGETAEAVSYLLEEPLLKNQGVCVVLLLSEERESEKEESGKVESVNGEFEKGKSEKKIFVETGGSDKETDIHGAGQERLYELLTDGYTAWEKEILAKEMQEKELKEKEMKEKEMKEKEAAETSPRLETSKDNAEDVAGWTVPMQDGDGLLTPEGAYEKLYQERFEPEGDSYECTYNAKGNFYGILGEGEEVKDGETLMTRRTVVYDRISKNGKCQLFVAYKEYRDMDGNDRGTVILDFYAVDRESGKVIAGNKTAWGQVASKEYQEATGDK